MATMFLGQHCWQHPWSTEWLYLDAPSGPWFARPPSTLPQDEGWTSRAFSLHTSNGNSKFRKSSTNIVAPCQDQSSMLISSLVDLPFDDITRTPEFPQSSKSNITINFSSFPAEHIHFFISNHSLLLSTNILNLIQSRER